MKAPVNLRGVGPDAPLTVNANGGKQSDSPYRFDLLPPLALAEVAAILKHGADKYGDDNWYDLSPEECSGHVLQHAFAFLAGDTQEGGDPINHLRRVACRALMWLELEERRRRSELAEAPTRIEIPSPQFKAGDRVRIKHDDSPTYGGRMGVITERLPLGEAFDWKIRIDGESEDVPFDTEELELLPPDPKLTEWRNMSVAPVVPQTPAEDTALNKG